MQKKKGISLIVLSITILVMAILAATAIIALEDSGIIKRSKDSVTNNNYSDEYTRLTVIKNGILTDNLGTITVDEYITELRNNGLLETGEILNADGSKTVITKTGFEVVISQNGESDVTINMDGKNKDDNDSGNSNDNSENDSSTSETPTLLKFSINVYGMDFTYEEGMTWGEWYESEYCDKTRFRNEGSYISVSETGNINDTFWSSVEYWDIDCQFGDEDLTYYSDVDAQILPVTYII